MTATVVEATACGPAVTISAGAEDRGVVTYETSAEATTSLLSNDAERTLRGGAVQPFLSTTLHA